MQNYEMKGEKFYTLFVLYEMLLSYAFLMRPSMFPCLPVDIAGTQIKIYVLIRSKQ